MCLPSPVVPQCPISTEHHPSETSASPDRAPCERKALAQVRSRTESPLFCHRFWRVCVKIPFSGTFACWRRSHTYTYASLICHHLHRCSHTQALLTFRRVSRRTSNDRVTGPTP